MQPWRTILDLIERDGGAALVSLVELEGSGPREAGARMVVARDGTISGTIGGGTLEFEAIDFARDLIKKGAAAKWRTVSLGPALGQCCGGRVQLLEESFNASDRDWIAPLAAAQSELNLRAERGPDGRYRRRVAKHALDAGETVRRDGPALLERFGEELTPVVLFGAGHVGRALITALAPLPFTVRWIDERPDVFPLAVPDHVQAIVSALPESELHNTPDNTLVVVMTHSHGLDLALVAAALKEGRFPYVGLIGSASKRAHFAHRLVREFGLPKEDLLRLVCPIGVPGIGGKEPAVIAAGVAAELLLQRARLAAAPEAAPAESVHG
jgi:xanthine dehydrogenase accessory factor